MSLILDALNKADRERQNSEAPPGIHSVHQPRRFKQEKPLWLYLVLVFVTVVILGVLAWQLVISKPKPEAQTITTAVSEVDPLKKSTRIPGLPKPVLVQEEKPPAINKPAVDELYNEKKPSTATEVTKSRANTTRSTTKLQNQIYTSSTDSVAESENSSPQEIEAAALTVETLPSTPAPPPTPTSLSDFPQIGAIGSLPWTILNSLPSLSYSQHVYRGSQSESYVVLNDQRKREGQSLPENIRVEHIMRDGIILTFKDYKFKLRALNSWVNI